MSRGLMRPSGATAFGRYSRIHWLVLGSFIVAAVSVFHYWNLSAQYDDLVNKMTELQDVMKTCSVKRDAVVKHADGLQRRLKDTEDELGRTKLEANTRTAKLAAALRQMQDRGGDVNDQLKAQLSDAQQTAIKSRNVSLEEIANLQSQLDSMTLNYKSQMEKNSALQATIDDLRKELSNDRPVSFRSPPVRPYPGSKSVKNIPGQLPIVSEDKVEMWTKGLKGISMHEGGPLVFVPPQL